MEIVILDSVMMAADMEPLRLKDKGKGEHVHTGGPGVLQNLGAGPCRGSGRQNIIHQHNVPPGNLALNNLKCPLPDQAVRGW